MITAKAQELTASEGRSLSDKLSFYIYSPVESLSPTEVAPGNGSSVEICWNTSAIFDQQECGMLICTLPRVCTLQKWTATIKFCIIYTQRFQVPQKVSGTLLCRFVEHQSRIVFHQPVLLWLQVARPQRPGCLQTIVQYHWHLIGLQHNIHY